MNESRKKLLCFTLVNGNSAQKGKTTHRSTKSIEELYGRFNSTSLGRCLTGIPEIILFPSLLLYPHTPLLFKNATSKTHIPPCDVNGCANRFKTVPLSNDGFEHPDHLV